MDSTAKLILYFVCLGVYLLMNLISFIAMGLDKKQAQKHGSRISERMLFVWACLFGAMGGTLGMYKFRHKTQHWYFAVFFPLLAAVQFALLVWGNAALLIA